MKDSESGGCCSTKVMSSRGAVSGGTLSHWPEVCQGVSDVMALPVGMGTGRQHQENSAGCRKGCEGQKMGPGGDGV